MSVTRPQSDIEIVSVQGSHRHWCEAHDGFTVALVHREQGELVAEWRTRCRSLSTERGGLMLIEPGDVHVTQRVRARVGVADFDVIRFSPTLLARASRELGYRGDFHFRSPAAEDPLVFEALDRFVATVARGEGTLAVADACTHALTNVITRLGEQPRPHGLSLSAERDYRLRRVNDYLASHLDRRPTLEELEQVSGLSQWRLCARFNQSYGTSIGKCWNALRLRRAQRELERGRSLSMIASELGYRDEAYLCRVFKAHYGITPGTWRAMFRTNDCSVGRRRKAPLPR
jgi:AraC-like DNA-binding protein